MDERALVNEMWEITGVQTADCIAWSSQCMGEDVRTEAGSRAGECFLRHVSCPWHRWHEKRGLLAEDRPGCDRWFEATLRTINDRLGVAVRFETLSALPDGDDCCLRRIWQDETGHDPGPGKTDSGRPRS